MHQRYEDYFRTHVAGKIAEMANRDQIASAEMSQQKNFIAQLEFEVREQQEAAQHAQQVANNEFNRALEFENLAQQRTVSPVAPVIELSSAPAEQPKPALPIHSGTL